MVATDVETSLIIPADDAVVVFRTVKSGARGRLVRLGATADEILNAHQLPDAAAEALGQILALAGLIGSALPAQGRIILQTRTDGPASFLVADFEAPGRLRGYARFDAVALAAAVATGERLTPTAAMGEGHLAITIDESVGSERYQGVLALDGEPLDAAAAEYFQNRESLPTFVRVAVAKHFIRSEAGGAWRWRAGGLMIQSLADDAEVDDDGDHWTRARTLAATVEDHELLDPELSAERLLLRLFHEEGVRVERVAPLERYCRCSRDRVADVLDSFGAKELSDMIDDAGAVTVTCEFCATTYAFEPSEIATK